MIQIEDLKNSDKGREVKYTTHGSFEYGNITSWNEKFIFVRYHTKHMESLTGKTWKIPRTGTTSEATSPGDLEWA